jgi:hypothetical protein
MLVAMKVHKHCSPVLLAKVERKQGKAFRSD